MKPKTYQYCTFRDLAGLPAWRDDQTKRWINATTLARRTGLTMSHIKGFEKGRDGQGYCATLEDRQEAEAAAGVCLY